MIDIEKKLSEISKKHYDRLRKEYIKEESKYYAKLYSRRIKSVDKIQENISFQGNKEELCTSILVNNYKFSYKVDKYNNLQGKYNLFPTSYVIKVFADKLRRYEDRVNRQSKYDNPHTYRVTQNLFVSLAQQYYKKITPKKLYEILNISLKFPVERNDRLRYGFASWLLTRSYSCDDRGQFSPTGTFNSYRWKGEANFFRILSKDHNLAMFLNEYRLQSLRA